MRRIGPSTSQGSPRKPRARCASYWLNAKRALDFLGLPWDAAVLDYRQRSKRKAVASPTYEAVSKPLYTSSIGRWKHYAPWIEPHLHRLQPFVEAFGYD